MRQDYQANDIERQPLHHFTEQAYLDYAMYVILDRALPHIGDGLKPVQRRIIYAMSELGLKASSKFKKSARTVGDVLGKFHPHGDTACYEAMVLMAQTFSYRYPLVDGQGNWGSIDDPKSFAAMRYTEARLAAFSELLLGEIDQGTVDWVANFDGTLDEPAVLPARLPHVLLNGGSGIAVGMATDIPPHNLNEVAAACMHLLDNPDATVSDLCQHIPAPDFPSDAEIITPQAELQKIYETGTGSLRMRACYTREDSDIIITALPYQTSGAKIIAQIAAQMNAKKLPMLEDVRDESDHENPIRLVLELRSNRVDIEAVMAHLFATTDLERSYRVNLNVIGLDNRPQVKNLRMMLTEWLTFRKETVRRRLQYRLDKIDKRLHLLEGLLIAYLNLDEVIHLIREEDKPKAALIARFGLSDAQAEAILELKLRQLAKLEEIKIKGEQDDLAQEREKIVKYLDSEHELHKLIKREIRADVKKYGNERRSPLVEREAAQALDQNNLVAAELITVVLSVKGWVRAGKGHEIDPATLNYRAGDELAEFCRGKNTQQAVFFDNFGRSYAVPAHTLPSARGLGEPLASRFTPPSGAIFQQVLLDDTDSRYLLATNQGYGFISTYADLISKNKAGKGVVTLGDEAQMLAPLRIDAEHDHYALITSNGHIAVVSLEGLPQMARGKGVKLLNIPAKSTETVCALVLLKLETAELVLQVGSRHLDLRNRDVRHYVVERGQRGKLLPPGYRQIEEITLMVNDCSKSA